MKINTISSSDPDYPKRLLSISDAPPLLYSLGNVTPVGTSVALVGSRKPTAYGVTVTTQIAEGLARRGVVVVSGLALGVDAIAHRAALNAGGTTIAVQANGLDTVTPRSHRQLAIDILEHSGGLLSEYEPGTPPLQFRFLQRNRLVSGLADAVVVTEASARSGTMNTVMHALQQGRDVYAVPGNITSPTSAGCNKLIEQGATPIIDVGAFLDLIAPLEDQPAEQLLLAENDAEQAIVDLICAGVSDGELLQKQSKLDAVTFSTALTMLELRSVIRPLGANNWSL